MPRVVIAAPLYGQAGPLREALASLLSQTFEDFRLVLVDDRSQDETVDVVRALADPRVELHVNERRLGMLGNTNRAWAMSRAAYPDATYWALGSDHDVWAPTWLERLVEALDARPQAVLAYPRTRRVDAAGRTVAESWSFSTEGIADPRARLRHALSRMVSGDMIYGLFRAQALDRHGFYRPVLAPDRLLLSELALDGEFVQVPEVLWSRRYVNRGLLSRQRAAFWPDRRPPLAAHLPWWTVHAGEYARRHGTGSALRDYVPASLAFQARSRTLRAADAVLAPPVKAVLRHEPIRRATADRVIPALRATREVLERLAEERDPR
jgi:glycosyltransferase involved in cell wall biosynthesis